MADVHYTMDVPRGRERFRELVVHISRLCENDPYFGATKLNKALFYADVRAYERFGIPLTGLPYFRLDRGPAPRHMVVIRRDLIEEGAIKIEDRPYEGNHTQTRTIALREPDLTLFTKGELALVDEVIADLAGKSARLLSDESHKIAWHVLGDRDLIPYEVAFLSDEPATPDDISDARSLNDKYKWGLRV